MPSTWAVPLLSCALMVALTVWGVHEGAARQGQHARDIAQAGAWLRRALQVSLFCSGLAVAASVRQPERVVCSVCSATVLNVLLLCSGKVRYSSVFVHAVSRTTNMRGEVGAA